MITIARGLAVGVVVTGAALGMASPTSAAPPTGSFVASVTESRGDIAAPVGSTLTLTLISCGPACVTVGTPKSRAPWQSDLHLQGNTYTGTRTTPNGSNCALTLDSNATNFAQDCGDVYMRYQLSRSG
jgi:hypothetical protein